MYLAEKGETGRGEKKEAAVLSEGVDQRVLRIVIEGGEGGQPLRPLSYCFSFTARGEPGNEK